MMKSLTLRASVLTTLCACPLLCVVSCSSDDDESSVESTVKVHAYFASSNSSTVELSASETSFTVTLRRLTAGSEVTIDIASSQEAVSSVSSSSIGSSSSGITSSSSSLFPNNVSASGNTADYGNGALTFDDASVTRSSEVSLFAIPSTVTFEQGAATADIVIAYDPADVGYESYTQITLALDEADTAPYNSSSFTFIAYIPTPWASLGNCTFTEDFMTTYYTFSPPTYEVELQESEITDSHFRLVNPFGEAYPYNISGDWDDSQDWYLEIHAEDPDGVYIPLQQTGMDWGYGNVVVGSLAAYYMDNGYSLEAVKALGITGTYADGQITFPYRTLVVHMPDYDDQYYYANYNTAFCVVVPEIDQTVYSTVDAGTN